MRACVGCVLRAWGACCVCGVRVVCMWYVGNILLACSACAWYECVASVYCVLRVACMQKRILAPTLQEAMRLKNECLTIILIVKIILIWFKAGRNIVGCYSKGQLFMII